MKLQKHFNTLKGKLQKQIYALRNKLQKQLHTIRNDPKNLFLKETTKTIYI